MMEILNNFANMIGFGTFFGMIMFLLWCALWLGFGLAITHGVNKPKK